MANKIRVLIADDHTIVRAGVRQLLEAEDDLEVVGEAVDGSRALELAKSLQPDVILMDIGMPGMNGLEATQKIKAAFPDIHVLVLTMHRSDEYFFEMLKAGASGYVLKGAETNELIGAIRVASEGQVFLHPEMTKQLVHGYLNRSGDGSGPGHYPLTSREKEILKLLGEGCDNAEIAKRLNVAASTVHSHRTNLMRKLKLGSRDDLVQYARQRGLLHNF